MGVTPCLRTGAHATAGDALGSKDCIYPLQEGALHRLTVVFHSRARRLRCERVHAYSVRRGPRREVPPKTRRAEKEDDEGKKKGLGSLAAS